jgi:general secretion pathway protein D
MNAPRVIAINNQIATIDMTRQFPYVLEYKPETSSTSNDTNSTTSTTLVPIWEEKDLGFKLRVRPSIGGDLKTINLVMEPEISDIIGREESKILVINSEVDDPQNELSRDVERPVFTTQKLNVSAIVEDGGTVVIGGLISEDKDHTRSGVPILNKVPGLRHLFESKHNRRLRTFDLIFVTAQIVTPGNRHYEKTTSSSSPRRL